MELPTHRGLFFIAETCTELCRSIKCSEASTVDRADKHAELSEIGLTASKSAGDFCEMAPVGGFRLKEMHILLGESCFGTNVRQ
jgi:hypothetical protein